jgi:hypothetical protein
MIFCFHLGVDPPLARPGSLPSCCPFLVWHDHLVHMFRLNVCMRSRSTGFMVQLFPGTQVWSCLVPPLLFPVSPEIAAHSVFASAHTAAVYALPSPPPSAPVPPVRVAPRQCHVITPVLLVLRSAYRFVRFPRVCYSLNICCCAHTGFSLRYLRRFFPVSTRPCAVCRSRLFVFHVRNHVFRFSVCHWQLGFSK